MAEEEVKYEVGSHAWPCTQVLGSFISVNRDVFNGKTILELGSGAVGVGGIATAMAGAKKVYMTDGEGKEEIFSILRHNIVNNKVEDICSVHVLDWSSPSSLDSFLSILDPNESIDWIVASDVFFDPSVFEPLINTIDRLLTRFPSLQLILTYQIRCVAWTLECFVKTRSLVGSLVRECESEGHSIQLAVIYRSQKRLIVAGIEGGASISKLVFVDIESGEVIGRSEYKGSNQYLDGTQATGDSLAKWIRQAKQDNGIVGRLTAIGMGLSGAEDDKINGLLIDYLLSEHGDLAGTIYLQSDAVATVAACFPCGGVVVIAGTGSSTRMLCSNGKMEGVGGWGHVIGDGGSGYWIANRGMRLIFDVEDGLEDGQIDGLREVVFNHFNIDDKVSLLDLFYAKFNKPFLAKLTGVLANHTDDPTIARLFYDGGFILGNQLRALTKKIPQGDSDMRSNLRVLLVGSVFKSWEALKGGFVDGLNIGSTGVSKVTLYRSDADASMGAAALGAKSAGKQMKMKTLGEESLFDRVQI